MHPMPRARLQRKPRILIAVMLALAVVGCSKAEPGEKGDPGPAGPPGQKGDAGPRGPAGPAGAGLRVVRASCDASGCTAQCADDEVLLTAYCGATRNPAIFPTERSASCRLHNPANSPVVAACAKPMP
jgi:hypothetical protein